MLKIGLVTALFVALSGVAIAGNCDYSWQSASDGSNCGNRAADQRPNQYQPPNNSSYNSWHGGNNSTRNSWGNHR